uniref:Uncharacterized protein n=1 Tax=Romanomermis culicivorax TaxID=13658 RepID=A0A915JC87_ROMCU
MQQTLNMNLPLFDESNNNNNLDLLQTSAFQQNIHGRHTVDYTENNTNDTITNE